MSLSFVTVHHLAQELGDRKSLDKPSHLRRYFLVAWCALQKRTIGSVNKSLHISSTGIVHCKIRPCDSISAHDYWGIVKHVIGIRNIAFDGRAVRNGHSRI